MHFEWGMKSANAIDFGSREAMRDGRKDHLGSEVDRSRCLLSSIKVG